MTNHKGLPVAGYAPTQNNDAVELVNEGKILQERVLRYVDKLDKARLDPKDVGEDSPAYLPAYDRRAVATARTHAEAAFTLLARAVFQPAGVPRIVLPEDRFNAPSARGQ